MIIALVTASTTFLRTASGGSATKTMTLSAATTAGNALRMQIVCSNTQAVNSITGGGTWAMTGVESDVPTGLNTEIWCCENCTSVSSVSITQATTYAREDCMFTEWSGMPTTRVDDPSPSVTATAGSGTNPSTPSITPSATTPLLLMGTIVVPPGQTISAGPTNGWTALTQTGAGQKSTMAYKIVDPGAGAAQSFSVTKSLSYGQSIALIAAWDGSAAASSASGRRAVPSDSNARRGVPA